MQEKDFDRENISFSNKQYKNKIFYINRYLKEMKSNGKI
jgi:hypothetical protein